ncbi:MAG: DUF3800 domain-containing protein [Rhodospirillales bacterium]|nr:DUF3800 domain-containing protein [Rhodospirillales bacterium]MCW9002601.1 DUF3800 domain-containing protein [Rhodospirillales bacterium]
MRFAFIDEAGTSRNDPHVVVAAVVVHGDNELIPLENHLEELVEKHIPKNDRADFVFHMKDIWSGAKYFKDNTVWPIERRIAIMNDLVAVPGRFELPIAFAFMERAAFLREHPELEGNPKATDLGIHAIVFTACTAAIERLMTSTWPKEVAQLVAEDHDQARATIKEVHAHIRDKNKWDVANKSANPGVEGLAPFPLQRIRGGIQFADKRESHPLQIADMCAFFIRGHLRGHPQADQFYNSFKPWMVVLPKGETSPWDGE